MKTAIVTLFPELVDGFLTTGVLGRAVRDGRLECARFNPRNYAHDARKTVDDRPFGGGAGMVMMVEPLGEAVSAARSAVPEGAPVVFLSPQGERFDHRIAAELAALEGFVLVAARYEGVDERFVERHVDRELSIGDYVLSGGELAALVVLDSAVRLLPGVVGNPDSITRESHVDGLLDYPQYTRPRDAHDGTYSRGPVVWQPWGRGDVAEARSAGANLAAATGSATRPRTRRR